MTDTFQPKAVKVHYHGETFDTKQEIHEISDAWLIAADVIGTCSDDGLVFYDTGRLEKRSDGYHLYENNYPRFFMVDTSKVGADLRKIDVSELANMSFTDFVRIGFNLGRENYGEI
ncbi:hypothetical protein P4472_08890 [Bacillus subtilis]|nr:hypothetical protein [Bacillus subtilis]MEC0313934.1 hypothetical protein [Bacillus subtilis]MEC0360842.1 hypothetical protein [Bacillus subtilis]MED3602058.1 hypothetical protein [Bacillus subtilis]MED3692454.1 hypothetical protein [Bacillus subtilis]